MTCLSPERLDPSSDTDSRTVRCRNCDGYVCVACGRTHVESAMEICTDCPAAQDPGWEPDLEWERTRGAEARAHRARMAQLRRECKL